MMPAVWVVVAVFALGQSAPPEPAITNIGRVVSVIDGDTIDVEFKTTVRIRLKDCWAPESKIDHRVPEGEQQAQKQAGIDAKSHLTHLAMNQDVVCKIPLSPDGQLRKSITLDRAIGVVWISGQDVSLNERMVASGHAEAKKPRYR